MFKPTLSVILVITILLVGTIGISQSFQPSYAIGGANGKIAFSSNRDGHLDIYTMNADGSGQSRLTNNFGGEFLSWSPDGTKIAFESKKDNTWRIYTINADGSGVKRVSPINFLESSYPSWSPDGTKIAFEGNDDIYTMNADGSGTPTDLTNHNISSNTPSWSPDGTKIAFESRITGNDEIYTMNADGSGQSRLTTTAPGDIFNGHSYPRWSPDGTKIAFIGQRTDINCYYYSDCWEIYSMNADGSGTPTDLTNNSVLDEYPSWSPDGTKITFDSYRDGNFEIYTMNADGSGQSRLTNNLTVDEIPGWGSATKTQGLLANAGPDQIVNGSYTVTLDGSKSSGGSHYSWTQLTKTTTPSCQSCDADEPLVTMYHTDTANPTFAAPKPTATDQVLEIQLTVSDDNNNKNTDTVLVTVKPHFPIILLPGVGGTSLYTSNVTPLLETWPVPTNFPVFMGFSSTGISLDNVVTGSILDYNIAYAGPNFYGPMEQYLVNKGYTLGKDLFLLPYDWRMPNNYHWSDLDHTIQTALDGAHQTEKVPQTKVLLLAHSMGGIIAKSYLQSSNLQVNNVAGMITMGTPYWGAVKPYYALAQGYTFDDPAMNFYLDQLKCIEQNVPSVYELGPKNGFLLTPTGQTLDLDTTFSTTKYTGVSVPSHGGYGNGNSCPAYNGNQRDWAPNMLLYNRANAFYQTNFGTYNAQKPIPSQFKEYVIVGVGLQTLGGYQEQTVKGGNYKNSILVQNTNVNLQPIPTDGDGTVPLWSSEYVKDATFKYYVQNRGTADGLSSSHGVLPSNYDVQYIVGSIADNAPAPVSAYPNPNNAISSLAPEASFYSKYSIPSPTLSVTVTTDKPQYTNSLISTASITVKVKDLDKKNISAADVTISVTDNLNNVKCGPSSTLTDFSGNGYFTCLLHGYAPGTYTITAQASKDNYYPGTGKVNFNVK